MKSWSTPQDETQQILDSIRRIVRALRVSSRASERGFGLSGAQFFVLQKLSDGAGLSLNELAARTLTHQSSVSVVVSKLVARGLVQRKKSRQDERRVEISIAQKGLSLLSKAPEPIQERLIAAIESLPPARREVLCAGLTTIVDLAGIADDPAPLFFEESERESS